MITLDLKGRSKLHYTSVGVLMDAVNNGFKSYLGEIFYDVPPYLIYLTDITLANFTGSSPKSSYWHLPDRTKVLI